MPSKLKLDKEIKLNIDYKKIKEFYNKFINGNNRILVLEVGNVTTKMIEYEVTSKGIEVLDGFIENTPIDAIDDIGIIDIDLLYKIILPKIKEKRFKTRELIISIVSKEIITRDLDIPKMETKDLENFVTLNSPDIFPVKLKDYLLSYSVMGQNNSKFKKNRIKIGAIPKEIVVPYISLAGKLKLHLTGVNYSGYELYNFIDYELAEHKKSYALIDIGAKYTGLIIVSDGILRFNRIIEQSSYKENERVEGETGCSEAKAEELKKKYNSVIEEDILNIKKEVLDSIMQEIVRVIDFYNASNSKDKVEKVYVTGLASNVLGIEEYFEGKLGITTQKIKNFTKVNFSDKAKALKDEQVSFVNCFGAYDFKNREYRLIKGAVRLSNMLFIFNPKFYKALGGFIALVVIYSTFLYTQILALENQTAEYTSYIDSNEAVKKLQVQVREKNIERKTYINIIKELDASGSSNLESFKNIEDSIRAFSSFANIDIISYEILKDTIDIKCKAELKDSKLPENSKEYISYKNIVFDLKDKLSEHFEVVGYTQTSKDKSFTYSLKIKGESKDSN